MKLSAHHVVRIKRLNRLQDFDFLISDRFAICSDWRLHCDVCKNFEQMIWPYVPNGACLIVKSAAALYTKIFVHGNLHALDIVTVPERFEERIRKTEEDRVTNRRFAEVMIDTEDRCLRKRSKQNTVELTRRSQVS